MDDFWAPIVKDNVFFTDAVTSEISNYVYDPSSSRPPSQFSANDYYLCLDDDGYGSNYVYESSSSTSPPSHFSTNGSLVCLENDEEYGNLVPEHPIEYPIPQRHALLVQEDGDLVPPIPPSRTRSKMHDLAVKHRLITDQNTRISGGQLVLSAEEKRTLIQEGYELPTSLPLTREQEESLKIVRRKIKNKLSAQESRRKRKEYIDTLEKKVHMYYNEALSLRNRLKQSETEKRSLAEQLKRYQQCVDIKDKSMLL